MKEHKAWSPVKYGPFEAGCVQALARGDATEDQQKRGLDWIINVVCATYDQSYHPGGEDGRRDTDFMEGRRFCGNTLVKLTKLSMNELLKEENDVRNQAETDVAHDGRGRRGRRKP